MIGWRWIPGGWATNLDGTDAAVVFTLPRLEVRSSPAGWQGVCLLENGVRSSCGAALQGAAALAKDVTLDRAAPMLPPRYREVLRALRGHAAGQG